MYRIPYPSVGELQTTPIRDQYYLNIDDEALLAKLDPSSILLPPAPTPLLPSVFPCNYLFLKEPSVEDVLQLGLGDCYFLSTLINIISSKYGPEKIVRNMRFLKREGRICVRLHYRLKQGSESKLVPHYIHIEPTIFMDSQLETFHPSACWVHYLQKAYLAGAIHFGLRNWHDQAGNPKTFREAIRGGYTDELYECIVGEEISANPTTHPQQAGATDAKALALYEIMESVATTPVPTPEHIDFMIQNVVCVYRGRMRHPVIMSEIENCVISQPMAIVVVDYQKFLADYRMFFKKLTDDFASRDISGWTECLSAAIKIWCFTALYDPSRLTILWCLSEYIKDLPLPLLSITGAYSSYQKKVFEEIARTLSKGRAVMCMTREKMGRDPLSEKGLAPHHAYAILGFCERDVVAPDGIRTLKFLRLKNPHGRNICYYRWIKKADVYILSGYGEDAADVGVPIDKIWGNLQFAGPPKREFILSGAMGDTAGVFMLELADLTQGCYQYDTSSYTSSYV